uniref:retinol dehydrogenase 11-like n=1 Tax=Styela clava TaxID=7725 RepID=UPI00193A7465|nr:retinol dehydrogenase 11-like [Styela clava]
MNEIALYSACCSLWLYLLAVVIRRKLQCVCDDRMDGKTVIITGGSDGLGKATAFNLARRGARIIITCRDWQKGLAVKQEIEMKTDNSEIILKKLDLSDYTSVQKFVDQIVKTEEKVDVLINNAGIGIGSTVNKNGHPIIFATNHLGPFLLTLSLMDLLRKSSNPRIVFVSSVGHRWGHIVFDTIETEDGGSVPAQFRAYTQSKLAQILFMKELHKREHKNGFSVFSVQPGTIFTGIFRGFPWLLKLITYPLFYLILKTADEGCQTQVHCSVSSGLEIYSGKHFTECRPEEPILPADHQQIAEDLWEYSEKAVGYFSKKSSNIQPYYKEASINYFTSYLDDFRQR